jgi:hypothetical protein
MLRLGIHIAKENNTIVKRVGARIRTESTELIIGPNPPSSCEMNESLLKMIILQRLLWEKSAPPY